jgi:hypothetical protein
MSARFKIVTTTTCRSCRCSSQSRTSVAFSKSVEINLGGIPGKLAIASATRNPGGRAGLKPAPTTTRFRGYDGGAVADLLCEL